MFNIHLPETKRFLYNVIINWYNEVSKKTVFRTNFCYTFYGVRRIGKTILLKQLNEIISNSKYYDCSNYQNDVNDLLEDIDNDYESGIRVFLLDEICKYYDLSNLINTIKISGYNMTFIITGSTPKFVENIGYRICSGPIVYLSPITYCEWLSWENNINYNEAFMVSNFNIFLDYIKNGTSSIILNSSEYIRSVVEDTMTSYKIRSLNKDINKNLEIDFELLTKLMQYMALVNASEIEDSGNYTGVTTFFVNNTNEKIRIKKLIK